MKKLLLSALVMASIGFSVPAFAAEITVSAAQSLKNAFTDIAAAYTKAGGADVKLNFAGSGNLLKQMESGAPVDVFASADQQTMDKAVAKDLMNPSTRKNFALNDLVLIARAPGLVNDSADLKKKDVQHIAIGKPETVPAGNYARDALTAAKLWDVLQGKYIFGDNVRQVLSYVQRGEADAGFVYRTDALPVQKEVVIVTAMTGHKPVLYPIAVARNAADAADAQKFVDFILSAEGQKILAGYGFSKAE